jgi:hypothetical protein
VYRERPGCRIIWERERHWLDVEGTSGVAEVRRYNGRRWPGPERCDVARRRKGSGGAPLPRSDANCGSSSPALR